jgi:hypothetical protein
MQTRMSDSLANRREPAVGTAGPVRRRAPHTYGTPSVREMTPAETEAQRRLVRASLLAKPA